MINLLLSLQSSTISLRRGLLSKMRSWGGGVPNATFSLWNERTYFPYQYTSMVPESYFQQLGWNGAPSPLPQPPHYWNHDSLCALSFTIGLCLPSSLSTPPPQCAVKPTFCVTPARDSTRRRQGGGARQNSATSQGIGMFGASEGTGRKGTPPVKNRRDRRPATTPKKDAFAPDPSSLTDSYPKTSFGGRLLPFRYPRAATRNESNKQPLSFRFPPNSSPDLPKFILL